jgi:hypothetical protein
MCPQTVEGGIWFCPLERAEALRLRRRPQSNATTETTSSLRPLGRIRLDPSGGAEPPHQPHPRIASRGRIQGSGTAIRLAGTPTKGWLGFGGPKEPGAADEYAASTRRPSPGRVLAKPGSSHCTTQSAPPLWSAWVAPTDLLPICLAAFECGSIAGGWGRTRRRERGTLLRPRSRSPAAPAFLRNFPGFGPVGKSAF